MLLRELQDLCELIEPGQKRVMGASNQFEAQDYLLGINHMYRLRHRLADELSETDKEEFDAYPIARSIFLNIEVEVTWEEAKLLAKRVVIFFLSDLDEEGVAAISRDLLVHNSDAPDALAEGTL